MVCFSLLNVLTKSLYYLSVFYLIHLLEEELQATALKWINEFITLAKDVVIAFTPQLISAVLPSLAHSVAYILLYIFQLQAIHLILPTMSLTKLFTYQNGSS